MGDKKKKAPSDADLVREAIHGRTFEHRGERLVIAVGQYGNGRAAVQLDGPEGPEGRLTVNLVDEPDPAPGELHVKAYEENEGIAASALASGLFVDTGRRIPCGFVEAQVWRVADIVVRHEAKPVPDEQTGDDWPSGSFKVPGGFKKLAADMLADGSAPKRGGVEVRVSAVGGESTAKSMALVSMASALQALRSKLEAVDFGRLRAILTGHNVVLHRGENLLTVVSGLEKKVRIALPLGGALVVEADFSDADWRRAFEGLDEVGR